MKKELLNSDKELLLKDLCARLPYGVKIALKNSEAYHHDNIAKIGDTTIDKLKGFDGKYFRIVHDNPLDWSWFINEINIEDIKPYLFPLSSMTEEQKKEFKEISKCEYEIRNYGGFDSEGVYLIEIGKYEYEHDINTAIEEFYFNHEIIDWFNKNYFDYRGLIEKCLAIDCTNLNIY